MENLPSIFVQREKYPFLPDDVFMPIEAPIVPKEMEGYINSLKISYPELLVFLTGGDANLFETNLNKSIFVDTFLVLKGLNRILNYNNSNI